MRLFITGGTGFIGPAVLRELLRAGHQVTGLARSDDSAHALQRLGADATRGTLHDLDVLHDAASRSDGVVHLATTHGETALTAALETDRMAIDAFAEAFVGSDRPLLFASATSLIAPGSMLTELDPRRLDSASARAQGEARGLRWADRGVRVAAVRLATLVHGPGDGKGFLSMLIAVARQRQVSAFVDDGSHRWPAIHRDDAAIVFRRAIDRADPGSRLHAVAEPGIAFRRIAEAIGAVLDLPVISIDTAAAGSHFSLLGPLASLVHTDIAASNQMTCQHLAWTPSSDDVLDDLRSESYRSLTRVTTR